MKPQAVEFLVHLSLAAGVASVNSLADDMQREALEVKDDSNNRRSSVAQLLSQSEHIPSSAPMVVRPNAFSQRVSVTGAKLDLQWRELRNVEYLTDGGNSWIHTAILDGKTVVVKTLKPECQDLVLAINEIESELGECKSGRNLNHASYLALSSCERTTSIAHHRPIFSLQLSIRD
jgi:hypothetical protein